MPLTYAQMAAKSAVVTFEFDGSQVNITYYPNKINDAMIERLDGDYETLTQALSEIISSWDVYEDAEQTVMFPLDAARMKELSWPFRLALRQAIIRHIRPNGGATQV